MSLTLADFDYALPAELIAQAPLPQRSASRLLVVEGERHKDGNFVDLPLWLRAGDLLVLNDSRVLHARLLGHKESGGRVEILVERLLDHATALAQLRASKGVTVNTVSPGYIGTDMVRAIREDVLEKIVATIPVKRLGEPAEIASMVSWLASDQSGFTTGANLACNGGNHMV